MSGIAAIVRFDGGPVEPGAIAAMTSAMAFRGPDSVAHWTRGAVALGHCMLHTTAESFEAAQPLANADESLIVVLDGWLSNWEELRSNLLSRGATLRNRCDAELVLHAYAIWGEDCPRHIDGEFAFVVWDATRQEAFCARDHIGQKSLHYYYDGKRLIVASDVAAILAVPGVPQVVNRGMMAEVVANQWISREETLWQDVLRLQAAHSMRVGANGRHHQRYWLPPFDVRVRYAREEDYVEHYRAVLSDCVRRASRSHLPLGCEVSGGLDSSAVFAVAHRLLAQGKLAAPELKGYTYKFAPGSNAYELDFAHAVARHVGRDISEVEPFLPDLSWFAERVAADRTIPPYPNPAMAVNIGKAVVADGGRVVLNGEGGDDWMAGTPFYYAEHIAERDWRGLARTLAEDAGDIGWRTTALQVARYGLVPNLPGPIKRLGHRGREQLHRRQDPGAYWLQPDLQNVLNDRRAAIDGTEFSAIANPARRAMYMRMIGAFGDQYRIANSRQCALIGYEVRAPMYAREFMDFAFAIPERMRCRGSTWKYLHSRAMAGLLPAEVATRKSKAEFNISLDRHLSVMAQQLCETIPLHCNEFLDAEGMTRLYKFYEIAQYADKPRWELWGSIVCDMFVTNCG